MSDIAIVSQPDVALAKASPVAFAQIASRGWYKTAAHLDLLNDRLLACARRECRRLMVFMPPRHSKSETISHFFPDWWLGNFPDDRVILASYGADLARNWGREARNTLEEFGKPIFGIEIADDREAADDWVIANHRGGMKCVGIGGAITGRGANLLIIDDPVKNPEEAWSVTIQARNAQWWSGAAFTRLEPDAVVIVLMTRWHQNDLAGYILQNSQEDWEIINLPALAEDEDDALGRKKGEALWPARYDREALLKIKAELSKDEVGYYWQAEYQQKPTLPDGLLYFDREACEYGKRNVPEPRERYDTRPNPEAAADGYVLIWERPLTGSRYYIGADTADGKGETLGTWGATGGPDRNAAAVYKWPENVQVAEIYGRQEEHEYARLLDKWGRYYNNALLAVERNRRATLVALRELNYPALYVTPKAVDMHLAVMDQSRQVEYGWITDTKTRPVLLSDLREAISSGAIGAKSVGFWDEALTFVMGDPPAAAPGQHDDRIIAHGIAWQVRKAMSQGNSGAMQQLDSVWRR